MVGEAAMVHGPKLKSNQGQGEEKVHWPILRTGGQSRSDYG